MAKLRHIALQVPDLEKAAAFYERALELTRVATAESPIGNAIMLSDGVMNLTLLHFPDGKGGMINGPGWAGLHHFGFVVDDKAQLAANITNNTDAPVEADVTLAAQGINISQETAPVQTVTIPARGETKVTVIQDIELACHHPRADIDMPAVDINAKTLERHRTYVALVADACFGIVAEASPIKCDAR